MGGDVDQFVRSGVEQNAIERLPHAPPFRFISRILEVRREGGTSAARAAWSLRGDEPFFAWHFPGRPLVPGVLIGEALAQVSGLAWGLAEGAGVRLARMDLKVLVPVSPPAEIVLQSILTRVLGPMAMFDAAAHVAGTLVATATITLSCERPEHNQ